MVTASDPILTLSAPERKYKSATWTAGTVLPVSESCISLIPPPTVNGTNMVSAARLKTSNIGKSFNGEFLNEVMFKNVTSSAPWL